MITECKYVYACNYVDEELKSPTEEKVKHKNLLNAYCVFVNYAAYFRS